MHDQRQNTEVQRCVLEFIELGSSQREQGAPRMEQRYWSTKKRLTNRSTAPSGFGRWELPTWGGSSQLGVGAPEMPKEHWGATRSKLGEKLSNSGAHQC